MSLHIDAIEIIRKQVDNSKSSLLTNTKLTINSSKKLEVNFFVNLNKYEEVYIDIPIKNIVSLGRNDYWRNNNPSWFELINNWIYGKEWTDSVFDYFENEIENKKFPAENAKGSLEIESLGGLLTCTNGNHRLVGAVCWIASKYGDDAVLKKVKVVKFPLKELFTEFLNELNENDEVYLFEKDEFVLKKQYIKIVNKYLNYIKYIEIKNDNLVLLSSQKYYYCRLKYFNDILLNRDIKKKRLEPFINLKWKEMNKYYFDIMKINK